MTQLELYQMWAPDDAMWTQWVKPVVFMNMKKTQYEGSDLEDIVIQEISYDPAMAVIVDLEGKEAVNEGMGLARLGYRPIPLFNGLPSPGQSEVVSVKKLVNSLCGWAAEVRGLSLSKSANPAFLLDAGRMKGVGKIPGTFDNRWCVVPQDMPSAGYFKDHGISRIVVRTEKIQQDLQHILYQYQRSGIEIYICDQSGFRRYRVTKPHQYKSMFYRFLVVLGLARSAVGGFGMMMPVPSENAGRHYRAG